ncbi:hypothetical protein CAPTEDRAFT_185679, partial [Capitella teleta]
MHSVTRFLLLCMMVSSGTGFRILLLPVPLQNHLDYFVSLGKTLIDAGHQVHIILSSGYREVNYIEEQGLHVMRYFALDETCHLSTESFYRQASSSALAHPDPGIWTEIVEPFMATECKYLLIDEFLRQEAEMLQFHLAVVHGLRYARCLFLFPAILGIPFATM